MKKSLAPLILALITSLLPLAVSAQAAISVLGRGSQYFGKGAGVLSGEKLAAAGVSEVKTFSSKSDMTVLFLDKGGKVVKQFVVPRTSPQVLNEFRPSKFRQWAKTVRATTGSTLKARAKNFPFEASAFFTAVGAIQVYDLLYNNNPIAVSQFLDSQKDPLTYISFASFVAANGMTTDPLMEVIESKRLRFFLPYFGMSMGLMASNITHDLVKSKTLRACAKAMTSSSPEVDRLCDDAWEEMNNGWGDKFGEYTTGLVSMLGSTAFAGMIDWALASAGTKALQFTAMQVFFSGGPMGGGLAMKFTWSVIKNVQFLAIDHMLRVPVESFWLNAVGKGPSLNIASLCLGTLHQAWRFEVMGLQNPMKPSLDPLIKQYCSGDLKASLKTFGRLSAEWRIQNMKEVFAAHQSWQAYLNNFASHYRSSRLFYQHLTDEIWNKVYNNPEKTRISPLDQASPYFGIALDNKPEWPLYFEDQRSLSNDQAELVQETGKALQNWASKSQEVASLSVYEKRRLETWLQQMTSNDLRQVVMALQFLNNSLPDAAPTSQTTAAASLQKEYFSENFTKILIHAVSIMGRPSPMLNPGEGFLKAWARSQGRDYDSEKERKSEAFPRQYGHITTLSAPEYLIAAMTFGPDIEKGESILDRNALRGAVVFNPPRILAKGTVLNQSNLPILPDNKNYRTVFNNNIRIGDQQSFHSNWDWIRSGWIRSEVMNRDGNNMANWWKKNVESAYMDAWYDFESGYETIIKKFAVALMSQENWANTSGFSNSGLVQLDQERAIYLTFVNDLLNNRSPDQKSAQPYRLHKKTPEFLANENLHSLVRSYMEKWQTARQRFPEMRKPLNDQLDADKGVLVSRVKNQDLEKSKDELDKSLEEISNALRGVRGGDDLKLQLTELLKASHVELIDYGLVLNAASYSENHGTGGEPLRARCLNTKGVNLGGGSSAFKASGTSTNPGCPQ